MSKYRVQINAQATVYQKTGRMVNETAEVSGIVLPRQVEEELEYECKQLAVGFNGTTVKESDLDEYLKQLSAGIKKSMIDKGLVGN